MQNFYELQPIETNKSIVALGSQLNASVRELLDKEGLRKLNMQFKPVMYPNIIFHSFDLNQAVGISRHWMDVVGFMQTEEAGLNTFLESLELSKKLGLEALMPFDYPNIPSINNFYYRCLYSGDRNYHRGAIPVEEQKEVFIATMACLTNNTLTDNAARGVPSSIVKLLEPQRDDNAKYERALAIKDFIIPLVAGIDQANLNSVSRVIRESRGL